MIMIPCSMFFVLLAVVPAAALAHAIRGSRSSLASDMQPLTVARTLKRVQDEWKAQAAVFAECDKNASIPHLVNCQDAPSAFGKSCSTTVNAIVQGSSGDKSVAGEYMKDVCKESVMEGWHKQACEQFASDLNHAMSDDFYNNRYDFKAKSLCEKFWSRYTKEEKKRLVDEKAAAEKAAEDERLAFEAAVKKEAEDAARKHKAEAKAKAEEAASLAAQKKAEAEAVLHAAEEKAAEAEEAELKHKEAKEAAEKKAAEAARADREHQDAIAKLAKVPEKAVVKASTPPVEKVPVPPKTSIALPIPHGHPEAGSAKKAAANTTVPPLKCDKLDACLAEAGAADEQNASGKFKACFKNFCEELYGDAKLAKSDPRTALCDAKGKQAWDILAQANLKAQKAITDGNKAKASLVAVHSDTYKALLHVLQLDSTCRLQGQV